MQSGSAHLVQGARALAQAHATEPHTAHVVGAGGRSLRALHACPPGSPTTRNWLRPPPAELTCSVRTAVRTSADATCPVSNFRMATLVVSCTRIRVRTLMERNVGMTKFSAVPGPAEPLQLVCCINSAHTVLFPKPYSRRQQSWHGSSKWSATSR